MASYDCLFTHCRQRGVVLAVVLVVLVVMMLGAVSLLRSVDTSALLSGNIGFKRDSINSSAGGFSNSQRSGLNKAFEIMKSTTFKAKQTSVAGCPPPASNGTACSDAGVWAAMNFYPRMLESDENGVPLVLKSTAQFDSKFLGPVDVNGNKVRFLIERMCEIYGPPSVANCLVVREYSKGGEGRKPGKAGMPPEPLYRITVRTDGVRNSQTYAQWIVAMTYRQE